MNKRLSLLFALTVVFLFFVVSCASPPTISPDKMPSEITIRLPNVWKDENYQGEPFHTVFVIAALQDPVFKRLCENLRFNPLEKISNLETQCRHPGVKKIVITRNMPMQSSFPLLITQLHLCVHKLNPSMKKETQNTNRKKDERIYFYQNGSHFSLNNLRVSGIL